VVDNFILTINLDLILKAGLSFQDYLFLQLIKNGKKELMREYHSLFGMILDKKGVDRLINLGYLQINDSIKGYVFSNFITTDEFNTLVEIKESEVIEDLKRVYPKKTPSGKRLGLQNDKEKWGPKYISIIKGDRAMHNKVLECIEREKEHRKLAGQEEFWPLLTTYINNQRWEAFIDSVEAKQEDNIFSRDI
jgi:hypothetical protein